MKKVKKIFFLALLCLILSQTTIDIIPTEAGIEIYSHHEGTKQD